MLIEHQEYGLTLVDYKTQGAGVRPDLAVGHRAVGHKAVGQGWVPRAYGSWCQPLAAYRRAIGMEARCMNLIVNSAEPMAPVERLWSEEEVTAAWQCFGAALVIWRNEKA